MSGGNADEGWTLADLIDFEVELAQGADPDARERTIFARDIRPRLPAGDERARRRVGLRYWLAQRRGGDNAGALVSRALQWARLLLFAALFVSGAALITGLCAGAGRAVHVVVFVGATLILPWVLFIALRVARMLGYGIDRAPAGGMAVVSWLAARLGATRAQVAALRQANLADSGAARVVGTALSGVLRWMGLGFAAGLVLTFAGSLLVYDVRFYWEATPETGPLVERTVDFVAAPWAWAWPAARPDAAAIEASRARYVDGRRQVPGGAGAVSAWWRFLLMALLVWGVLPRLILIGANAWRLRRALATLDFQAPRHRALWRALTAVERGAVAPASADGALVVDVGGHGVGSDSVRGFLLRALRLNPQADHRVNVLDETAETAADAALADCPDHVVLLVEDWGLSPRQAGRLQARVRERIGLATPVTWLVLGIVDGMAVAPDADHLERWTAFIDDLRDPATEVAAYVPGR